MRTKYFLILILFGFFLNHKNLYGQLSPGDIAFVQYNADSPESFAFVTLTHIPTSTIIKFTDKGWSTSTNSFSANEGIITWTSPNTLINCGTIIYIYNSDSPSVSSSVGTATRSGDLNLSIGGDQILAYMGLDTSPAFIAAINFANSGWAADATDSNTSAIPPGLNDGTHCLHAGDFDNGKYNIASISDEQVNLLTSINNASNWIGSDTTHQTYSGTITVTDCPTTSNATDYFRSKTTGPAAWNSVYSWESSTDGSTNWIDATLYPDADASGVEIQTGHTIQITSAGIEITNTRVFGILELITSNDFSVEGDDEIEFYIENGGNFIVNNADSHPIGNAFGLVKTGGTLTAGANAHTAFFLHDYVSTLNGLFYFEDASICDWQKNAYPISNNGTGSETTTDDYDVGELFHPYPDDSGAMPIFRISSLPTGQAYGNSNNPNTIYAVLELNTTTAFNFQNPTSKTIVGGIRSAENIDASVAQYDNCGNLILGTDASHPFYPSAVPELSGSVSFTMLSAGLRLDNGAHVTENANIIMSSLTDTENHSINRAGGILNIDGSLDITNMRITNTASGSISVNNGGTLRTRNTGGLFGSGSAIVNAANFSMQDGSIVDYYATENQSISSGKTYYHLIFSGSGIKDPQNQTDVHDLGSITITGNPVVDYSGNNLGLVGENDTDFNMDGGRLIIGTGGTQPRPGGTYTITGGEIEFTGNSDTSIRVMPDYYDIRISGENKSPGGKGFTILNHLFVTSSGELSIPTSTDTETPYELNALGGITVEPNGILQLENNAVLMQNPGVSNSGNITQIRNAMVPSIQYNFWSSPVSGQNLYELYPDIPNNRVMVYNTETDFYTIIPNNPSNPPEFEFGVGYSIKGPSSNSPDGGGGTAVTATFIGTPHNESPISTENRIPLSTLGQGFNLIGNPYPSNLDLNLLNSAPANSGKIEQATFYFWDNTDNDDLYQQGPDYVNQNFATYNASGTGTGVPAPRFETTGKKPNGIVKPGQGFIVQAAPTAEFLEVTNTMRTKDVVRNGDYATYFKNGNTPVNDEIPRTDQFWLELVNPEGLHIQTAVSYFEEAEDTFEVYDSEIMSESVSDNIYTLSKDAVKLTIQGREGNFKNTDVIPLGVKFFVNGKYKIQLEETKGIFIHHQNIYLKDKAFNILHNLSVDGPYEIDGVAGEYTDRFEIVFKDGNTEGEPVLTTASQNKINILKRDNQIEISSSQDKITQVEIFNLSGRSIYKNEKIHAKKWIVSELPYESGILLIQVQTETGEVHRKKIIHQTEN